MKPEDIAWIEETIKALHQHPMRLDNKSYNLGTAIMIQRISRGMILRELSEILDVSQSHLSRIEKGQRRPSQKVLKKILQHLGGVVSYLELSRLLDF